MPTETPQILLRLRYYEAAQEYLRSLPMEHFMEATPQATQREITLASLALVRAQMPEVHVFNELLVQYPLKKEKQPRQVVPDNMIVLHSEKIEAEGSYDVPLQPARPFCMLEYVSRSSKRKDYDDNMRKYEHELKVPYYLLFAPEVQELTLYQHTGKRYRTVLPDDEGRCEISELKLAVAILDGWVRFWFRGELLPLPGDLLRQVHSLQRELDAAARELDAKARELDAERKQRLALEAELAALRRSRRNGTKDS